MAIYSTPPPPPYYSIIPRVTVEGTPRPHFRRRSPPCSLLLTFIRTTIQACPQEEEEEIMGNTLRCCIACMLPCGALDVVRVLHADGRVEEYSGRITAGEVMEANPKHVLAQPICEALVKQRPSFLHPETELQRGKIYLLVPTYHLRKQSKSKPKKTPTTSATTEQRLPPKPEVGGEVLGKDKDNLSSPVRSSDKMLRRSKLLGGHQRSVRSSKRSGGAVWRPMLDCIQETEEDLLMYR